MNFPLPTIAINYSLTPVVVLLILCLISMCGYVCVLVDASGAGKGEVEVVVKRDNKKLPVKLVDKGAGLYKAYFMPKEPINHLAFITFSKESVPGMVIHLLILSLKASFSFHKITQKTLKWLPYIQICHCFSHSLRFYYIRQE